MKDLGKVRKRERHTKKQKSFKKPKTKVQMKFILRVDSDTIEATSEMPSPQGKVETKIYGVDKLSGKIHSKSIIGYKHHLEEAQKSGNNRMT